jgi:hypothetical protein
MLLNGSVPVRIGILDSSPGAGATEKHFQFCHKWSFPAPENRPNNCNRQHRVRNVYHFDVVHTKVKPFAGHRTLQRENLIRRGG